MVRSLSLLVVVAIALGGLASCSGSAATPAAKPVQHGSLTVDGQARTYRLFRPPSVSGNRPAPLVVFLHGCFPGANGDGHASGLHFDDQANTGGFIAVYPDGLNGCWNLGRCCGPAADVTFIDRLLDRLVKDLPINQSRIFVTGVSGGAAMAYRLACQLSSRISAIASVAGWMWLDDECRPARPVSILEMHGTDDSAVPYEGGGNLQTSPIVAIVQRWTMLDGCAGDPVLGQSGITKTSTWSGCKAGTVVRLDTVVGGRHTWFGCSVAHCDPVPGEPKANQVVWDFFSQVKSNAG
jgi:polyhydroxybutyrate depolymerase